MDSSEEMWNKTTSEELMNNNKTEGEIKDSAAEAATGGVSSFMWGLPIEVVPEDPYPQDLPRTKR